MSEFIIVKAYIRGYVLPPVEVMLNVSHIVRMWESTINIDGKDVPCVYIDSTTTRCECYDGTLQDMFGKICNKGIRIGE